MAAKKPTKPADILKKNCPEGINRLQGKDYINHIGLVYLASLGDPWSCETEVLDVEKGSDGLPVYVMTKSTITVHSDPVRIYAAIGDASAKNTGIAKTALPRMSETRSCNRALRLFLGAPDTTAEEMPMGSETEIRRLRDVTRSRMAAGKWTAEQCTAAIGSFGAKTTSDLELPQLVELRSIIENLTGPEWSTRNKPA